VASITLQIEFGISRETGYKIFDRYKEWSGEWI